MLQPYSARGQIRTLLVEYKRLGRFYRRTDQEYGRNYFMFKVLYDYIGKSQWDSGEWKNEPSFIRISEDLTRIGLLGVKLKEELDSIELDAYTCYCSIAELLEKMGERCEGTYSELLEGYAQGFEFE